MQNIITGIDLLGSLIADRETGEHLDEYAGRMGQVAEQLSTRNLAAPDNEWVRAREEELQGRLGTGVQLTHAPNDNELAQKANEKLAPETLLGDAPIRWPDYPASGDPPYYNWMYPETGGVGSPDSLQMGGNAFAQTGFVATPYGVAYVPGDPVRVHFHLPAGTTQTVILPWRIESDHPHRIEVVDRDTLKFVASGHTHTAVRTEEGFDLDGPHDHDMFPVDVSGPCFPRTRPPIPTTSESGFGKTIPAGAEGGGHKNAPLPLPVLDAIQAETDDSKHTTWVDPYEYWSGDFVFEGDTHTHQVSGFQVLEADGHTHTFTEPTPPADRGLIPFLTGVEGEPLASPAEHPFGLNLSIDQGWLVASSPKPISPLLELVFDRSPQFQLPEQPGRAGDVIGIGPDLAPSRIAIRAADTAIAGSPTTLNVEVLGPEGSLHKNEVVVITTNNGDRIERATDETGRASFSVTPPASIDTLELTATLQSDTAVTETAQLDVFVEEGKGYGMSYGTDYGE